MRLPVDAAIAPAKIANYLLARRPENDKSQFLAGWLRCGRCRSTGRRHPQSTPPTRGNARRGNGVGQKFRISGTLSGPNGKSLRVESIWMTESATGTTKFITLFPAKES